MSEVRAIVIDTSVFFAAVEAAHRDHRECLDFLARAHAVQDAGLLLVREPPLFVLEFFSVSNRADEKYDKSLYPGFRLTDASRPLATTIVPFTEDDAHEIMEAIASRYLQPKRPSGRKRQPYCQGSDLMYLAVARKFRCPLVTIDDGPLLYGADGFHDVIRPGAWS